MTLQQAREALAPLNMMIRKEEDEYRVNFKGGREETAYYTPWLDDAVATGRDMAARQKS